MLNEHLWRIDQISEMCDWLVGRDCIGKNDLILSLYTRSFRGLACGTLLRTRLFFDTLYIGNEYVNDYVYIKY